MSNWLSSKLKVAETLLQQIDQKTAESLGKNEKSDLSIELNHNHSSSSSSDTKIEGGLVTPLKDQFKKKSNDLYSNNNSTRKKKDDPVIVPVSKPPLDPLPVRTSLTDSDWTQLLSTPDKSKSNSKATSPVTSYRNGGMSKVPVSKKAVGSKKNQKSPGGVSRSMQKLDVKDGGSTNGNRKRSDSEGSGSGDSVKVKSNVDSSNGNGIIGEKDESGVTLDVKVKSASVKSDGISERKKDAVGIKESGSAVDSRGGSSSSDGTSASDSDSSSGSEKEREKKAERARRRERVIAEKAAARAVEVIKEQENNVARLEGEKQSLEKILEERAKQQAQEASDLQTSMMETMDAVDLEKQKHNNTRMEAFARLTKLETANADFAKSLATTQWNLQQESNQVAELKQQVELKEAIQEDLRWKIAEIQRSRTSPNQFQPSIGVEFEREILEAEYSLTCDKITQLQDKEKKLKESIEILQKEIEVPTDVEVELKKRLAQLTNHLIQKQSQVEALSSEKATLMFRIETVTRLLEEEKSSPQYSDFAAGPSSTEDLEAGTWEMSKVKLRPIFADNIKSGSRHLGSLLRQLDSIFSAGAAFIRRNPHAKYFAVFYLVCLHIWVSYILTADSSASDARSGAVVSLENINMTRGP